MKRPFLAQINISSHYPRTGRYIFTRPGRLFLRFTLTKNVHTGSPHSFALIQFIHLKFALLPGFDITLRFASALEFRWTMNTFFQSHRTQWISRIQTLYCSAVSNRLRKHLLESKLHAGETPRCFRVGLSNILILLGCSQEDVAQYLSQKSGQVAKRYMQ